MQAGGDAKEGLEDIDDFNEWVVSTMDSLFDRCDLALDAARAANRAAPDEPSAQQGACVPGAIAGTKAEREKLKASAFQRFNNAQELRPQLAFEDRIDNSRTPFQPRLDHWPTHVRHVNGHHDQETSST